MEGNSDTTAEMFEPSQSETREGQWTFPAVPRKLSSEEERRLAADTQCIPEFKRNKLEVEARKNWDLFYKRNSTNFFKDRHWTTREFEELIAATEQGNPKLTSLLEVGCGVGNTVYPLKSANPGLFIHCCDFSPRAVQFVKEHPDYDATRVNAFQCDITSEELTNHVKPEVVDLVTMFFVLSAIHPDKMVQSLKNIYKVLGPDGLVLFRDYGLYDHAMLRFSKGHKISDHFYVRQDGTRAYYFTTEYLRDIFHQAGFDEVVNEYVYRETVNKKEGLSVPRVFVQSKFCKRIEKS
ncbi:tRNA N(3)-cytidine methyltransferase METTL6-like [Diadema antillarum]|uniref:tRNA N(3)-cytidine methyltransferase METTL6-like n=1 Tax=Diadema antillarum TaxID=105358 RepID=UPI003A893B9C